MRFPSLSLCIIFFFSFSQFNLFLFPILLLNCPSAVLFFLFPPLPQLEFKKISTPILFFTLPFSSLSSFQLFFLNLTYIFYPLLFCLINYIPLLKFLLIYLLFFYTRSSHILSFPSTAPSVSLYKSLGSHVPWELCGEGGKEGGRRGGDGRKRRVIARRGSGRERDG